jgi:radical SAM protein with 4Fe4S-binding SPASM domain
MLGASAKTHEKMTKVSGSFENSIRGLKNLVNVGIKTCWQTVTNQYNFQELRQMIEKAISIRCHGFRVGSLDYMGQGREVQDIAPTAIQELAIWKFIGHSVLMYADQIHIGWGADVCKEDPWKFYILKPSKFMVQDDPSPEAYLRYSKNSLCGVAIRSFAMTANGEITPCPALSELSMGNVRQNDFNAIWRDGVYFQQIRKSMLEDFEGCSNCGVRFICGGGCRALSHYRHGTLTGTDVRRCDAYTSLSKTPSSKLPVFYEDRELEKAQNKFQLCDNQDNPFLGALKEGLGPWVPDNQILVRLLLQQSPDLVMR